MLLTTLPLQAYDERNSSERLSKIIGDSDSKITFEKEEAKKIEEPITGACPAALHQSEKQTKEDASKDEPLQSRER